MYSNGVSRLLNTLIKYLKLSKFTLVKFIIYNYILLVYHIKYLCHISVSNEISMPYWDYLIRIPFIDNNIIGENIHIKKYIIYPVHNNLVLSVFLVITQVFYQYICRTSSFPNDTTMSQSSFTHSTTILCDAQS